MFYGLNFAWHWSPFTLLALLIVCLLYILGIRHVRKNVSGETPLPIRRVASFIISILVMALLLLTPIDTIARTQLFSVHMFQAVTLTTVCAPLLIYACPGWLIRPLFEHPVFRPVARLLTQPIIASLLFNLNFLLWHAPALFSLALRNGTFYHVEMWMIFLTSIFNWWPLIGSVREMHRLSYPQQMLYAFLDGQPVDIFAFLLVFSFVTLYTHYHVPPQLGISSFADQAVGGALLLVPGLVDLVVMSPLFFRWLAQIEARAKIADEQRADEAERLAGEEEYEEEYEEEEEHSEA
jgi:putative membrane protein